MLWNAFTLTRANEEEKQIADLNAMDYGRCFFALSMTLIQGDPENLVANTKKLAFSHYVLQVNDLVSQGLPARQAFTMALESMEDRYLHENPWFERLLQVICRVDADPSLEDPGQAVMMLVDEILQDLKG